MTTLRRTAASANRKVVVEPSNIPSLCADRYPAVIPARRDGRTIVLYRVTWRREGWHSLVTRSFRQRAAALRLMAKLRIDDGRFRTVTRLRLDALVARDAEWRRVAL